MREILFRGKKEDNGVWIFGSLHIEYGEADRNGNKTLNYRILGKRGECDYVDPETVGQYTGLTDKNGKKIFEGDIVEHHLQGDILVTRGVVNWDKENARWAYQLNTMNPCFALYNPKAFEVIGNVYDHKELLNDNEM